MCVVVFAFNQHSKYRFILAANRDEFFSRPSAAMTWWEDAPDILAGRDMLRGGTWLGVTRRGRFALVTNFREPGIQRPDGTFNQALSRGLLVSDYLRSSDSAEAYLTGVQDRSNRYNGFNLVLGDEAGLHAYSNRDNLLRRLAPGLYGLSNHLLDTPWPKVRRAKKGLKELIDKNRVNTQALFDLLSDRQQPEDRYLPDTGVGIEWERLLAPVFVKAGDYGTCSSTVLLISKEDTITICEKTHEDLQKKPVCYEWHIQ